MFDIYDVEKHNNVVWEDSIPKCQELCQKHDECVGFSIKIGNKCRLKNKIKTREIREDENRASGLKFCPSKT